MTQTKLPRREYNSRWGFKDFIETVFIFMTTHVEGTPLPKANSTV